MYIKYLWTLVAFLVFSSCEKVQDISKSTFLAREILEEAVQQYNESLTPANHEGVIIAGTVEVDHLESEDLYLEFLVHNSREFRKYVFQYSKDIGPIKMPAKIERARVTYLGDNLIIQDLDKQETHAFQVETYQKRIEETNPYPGIGLASQIYQDKASLLSSAGSCSCVCRKCIGNCDFNCGAYNASCSCNGSDQSISCRSCYNAECTTCPE